MNEHEKLKWICDKIEHENKNYEEYETLNWCVYIDSIKNCNLISVREIIFTQEFINKFLNYKYTWDPAMECTKFRIDLSYETDNIVNYLYNLIK